MPLALRLRGKSTTQSHRSAIYYVDLTLRDATSLAEAIAQACETNDRRETQGYDQAALDKAARMGFGNALFEYDHDEAAALMQEFLANPDSDSSSRVTETAGTSASRLAKRLADKID